MDLRLISILDAIISDKRIYVGMTGIAAVKVPNPKYGRLLT